MNDHLFLLSPGKWLGEGTVTFSISPEKLRFYTSWEIEEKEGREILARQCVEIQSIDEKQNNKYRLFKISSKAFGVELKSDLIERVEGKGIINTDSISWKFQLPGVLEGSESYELQGDGSYLLHAEYTSTDTFRTVIEGCIWMKKPEIK